MVHAVVETAAIPLLVGLALLRALFLLGVVLFFFITPIAHNAAWLLLVFFALACGCTWTMRVIRGH